MQHISLLKVFDLFFTDLFPDKHSRYQSPDNFKFLPERHLCDQPVKGGRYIPVNDFQPDIFLTCQLNSSNHFPTCLNANAISQSLLVSSQSQVDQQESGFLFAEYLINIEIFPPGAIGEIFQARITQFHCDTVVVSALNMFLYHIHTQLRDMGRSYQGHFCIPEINGFNNIVFFFHNILS